MKITVYMRIALGQRGAKVSATIKPTQEPIDGYPTAFFAIDFDVPTEAFEFNKIVAAKVEIPKPTPNQARVVKVKKMPGV